MDEKIVGEVGEPMSSGIHLAYLDKAIDALKYVEDAKTRTNYAIGLFNDYILPNLEKK